MDVSITAVILSSLIQMIQLFNSLHFPLGVEVGVHHGHFDG